jgi:hypothetical protein
MRLLRILPKLSLLPFAFALPLGCSGEDSANQEDDFTSVEATLLTFEFDAELVTTDTWNLERQAEDQMLYTIGHLNGNRSVGRLDTMKVTDLVSTRQDDGTTVVKYHVVLPVAWGSKTNLPTSYELTLPKHIDSAGLSAFAEKYSHSCVDSGAHDVDSGSMWYYYRPHASGCELAPEDVVTTTATVTVSDENTSGKYPEYDKVWEDGALKVIAIFGKYEDGATTASDAGISAFNRFVGEVGKVLGAGTVTTPAELPKNPGVSTPDIAFSQTMEDGRKVEVVALLVDNVSTAGAKFNARYEPLSGKADLIFYNGHAGLGQNVRALSQKGEFFPGVYQIFFMNGCDTYAYVDGSLAEARAALNPDDPTGTKYMDMVTNAMPSFFHSMPAASMAMINGLLSRDDPKTYEEIFANIDDSEVVLVTGEEDNVFSPGTDPSDLWKGMTEAGSVPRGESVAFSAGKLQPGEYVITVAHDPENPGGDVDLYVALGKVASLETYDFRPYLDGSDEKVSFTLEKATEVSLMLHAYESGDAAESFFVLNAAQTAQ